MKHSQLTIPLHVPSRNGLVKFVIAVLLLGLAGASCAFAETLMLNSTKAEVYFSPKGGAEAAIVRAIENSRHEICVLAYSFTSEPVDEALVAAHKRGLSVLVILDKSQVTARGGRLHHLRDAGIPVLIDRAHAIAHNKVMILDGRRVITGSFNFTKSAEERNAENLLILHSRAVSQKYLQDFHRHMDHAHSVGLEDMSANELR